MHFRSRFLLAPASFRHFVNAIMAASTISRLTYFICFEYCGEISETKEKKKNCDSQYFSLHRVLIHYPQSVLNGKMCVAEKSSPSKYGKNK